MQKRPATLFFSFFLSAVALQLVVAAGLRAEHNEHPSVDITAGAAMTSMVNGGGGTGLGPYLGTAYSVPLEPFISLKAYGAMLFTFPNRGSAPAGCDRACTVTTQAVLLGGKARLAAPVNWVAPFAEAGVGLTVGSVISDTFDESLRVGPIGATLHVPIGVGLALGSMNETEISVQAIFHPEVKQIAGVISLTVVVPFEPDHSHRHDGYPNDKPWWKFF